MEETYEEMLGRIAYEAYAASSEWKSAITGCNLPSFADCPPAVVKGWLAVGEALLIQITNDATKETEELN